MHICEQIVNSSKYLEAQGMTQKQLSSLHHFYLKGRDISFALVNDYFGTNKNLQERNTNFGNRISYVANQYKKHNENITQLIQKAHEKWPLL